MRIYSQERPIRHKNICVKRADSISAFLIITCSFIKSFLPVRIQFLPPPEYKKILDFILAYDNINFLNRCVQVLNKYQKMDNLVKIFDSEKTLYVLQEIERNPKITQRALAQKLEISLGKSNFLIRALIDKGIIEIKNFKNSRNKLAYMYLLTPAGIKIKIQLTHKFFILKMREYEKLKEEMGRIKKEVAVNLPEEEPV